jgi:DnaJ family protein A protein 2
MTECYYKTLGINKPASATDIKKAYRTLAKTAHPDKGGSSEKFKVINQAYEVLSDAKKRQQYDRFGANFEQKAQQQQRNPFPFNIFQQHQQRRPQQKARTPDIRHIIQLSLSDVYNGTTKKLKVVRKRICTECTGHGTKDKTVSTCTKCQGGYITRMVQLGPGVMTQQRVPCGHCHASGIYVLPENKCETCNGHRVTPVATILTVNVKKGTRHGMTCTFNGEADEKPGCTTGHIIIIMHRNSNESIFDVKGVNDLTLVKTISLVDALSGTPFSIEHLDKRTLNYAGKHVITPETVIKIDKEGLPDVNTGVNGELYVSFKIQFPSNVCDAEKLTEAMNVPEVPGVI